MVHLFRVFCLEGVNRVLLEDQSRGIGIGFQGCSCHTPELDLLLSDPDDVSIGKPVLVNAYAPDVGTVPAAHVLDIDAIGASEYLGMMPGNLEVIELDGILGMTSDRDYTRNRDNPALVNP